MLASDHVENLVSVCSRSLFALRVLWAHGLPDEALHSVTRATCTTVARLMYAVPSWWGITAEKDKAKIERLYNRLERMGTSQQTPPVSRLLLIRPRRVYSDLST